MMSQFEKPVLPRSMLFGFSLPAVMQGFTHAPETLIQGIYAKHGGLSLEMLAGAILFTRLFDVFTYPLLGYLSDRTYRRTNTRKPWILLGTVITVLGLWNLYRPPNAQPTPLWFGAWTLVTYVGWKVTEISHGAWSFELSGDYIQRARIQLWRGMASLVGGLIFYLVPYGTRALGLSDTTELNFQSLGFAAVLILVFVPVMNLWTVMTVPNGAAAGSREISRPRESLASIVNSIVRNGPLLRLLATFIPITVLTGMSGSVTYMFLDTYLGLSAQLSMLMLVGIPFSLLGLPFWGWVCLKYERHRIWAISLLMCAAAYAGQSFVPPGQGGLLPLMLLYPLTIFCLTATGVAVPAMFGDVVDYGRLMFDEDRAGIYASIHAFLLKSLGGISAAAGLALVGWFGFDATGKTFSDGGILGLKMVAIWMPCFGIIVAAMVAWNFPINRARQAEIQARLAARREAGGAGANVQP